MKAPLLLAALACSVLAGCFPWVLPTVTHIPPVPLEGAPGIKGPDVRAFHCDVSTRHERLLIGITVSDDHTIGMKEVTTEDRATPRHVGTEVDRGLSLLGAFDFSARYHSTCIKLYCPGYATVVLGPRDDRSNISWVKLNGPDEEFQAVRDLMLALPVISAMPDPRPGPHEWSDRIHPRLGWDRVKDGERLHTHSANLRPASYGEEHERCLAFAKERCEAILKDREPDDALRKRIDYQIARLDELLAQ